MPQPPEFLSEVMHDLFENLEAAREDGYYFVLAEELGISGPYLDLVSKKLEQALWEVRESGQKEYAKETNAFANFENLARELGLTREQILWVYARKHIDGIASWIRGYRSQRESVRGRIMDLIMYLNILAAMEQDHTDYQTPSQS